MATATATRKKDDEKAARADAKKAQEKEKAAEAKAKAKAKEQERKDKEKAAKAKARAKEQERKDKEKAAKAKAKAKAKEQERKDKEKAAKARAKEQERKDKEKAAKAKAKAKEQERKDKEKAAKAKAEAKAQERKEQERKEKEAAKAADQGRDRERTSGDRGAGTGPKRRGGSTRPTRSAPSRDGSPKPQVHEKGWIAEELGRGGAVTRSTKRPTLAASFTTRDHDVIRRWAESRGGVPADVRGTGDGEGSSSAGVLRIEFRDDQHRLEDVGWDAFFTTFDESDVDFLYQEFTKDGGESRFHKIVRAED